MRRLRQTRSEKQVLINVVCTVSRLLQLKSTPRISDYGSKDGSKGAKNLGVNRRDHALSF